MEPEEIIHVVLADDHTLMRKGLVDLLQNENGITVDFEVEDGIQLLDQLEQAAILPHICILDIGMPEMDGFTALLEIKKRWPDMKTLILTTYGNEMNVIRMIHAGANGYLLKKCAWNELKEALFSIYREGHYYSEWANSKLFHLVNTKVIKPPQFTNSEIEVLKWCCTELTYEEIAEKMNTSFRSIDGYRSRLFNKLNVKSRVELVIFAVQFGLVPLEGTTTNLSLFTKSKK